VLGAKSGLFWMASVLMDIDHYWDFLYHNGFKDYSVETMFAYHAVIRKLCHRPNFLSLNVFHTVEVLLAILFIGMWCNSDVILVVFWGMLFHQLLDLIDLYRHRVLFKRAFSIIEYWIRKRVMIRQGLFPALVYREALGLIGEDL